MIPSLPIKLHQHVRAEFETDSRPATTSLATYHSQVSVIAGNNRLSHFANTGKPSGLETLAPTDQGSGTWLLRGDLGAVNGVRASYYWIYRVMTGGAGAWVATSVTDNVTTTGEKSTQVSGLDTDKEYEVRFMAYNGFNNAGSPGNPANNDHTEGNGIAFNVQPGDLGAMTNLQITANSSTNYTITWDQDTPHGTNFVFHYVLDDLSPSPSWTEGFSQSWDHVSGDSFTGEMNTSSPPSEFIRIRITAQQGGFADRTAEQIHFV